MFAFKRCMLLCLFISVIPIIWAYTPVPNTILFGHLTNGTQPVGMTLKGLAISSRKINADKSLGVVLETYTIGQRADGGNCYVIHIPIGASSLAPASTLRPGESCALFINGKQVSASLSANSLDASGSPLHRIDIDLAAYGIKISNRVHDDWALYE